MFNINLIGNHEVNIYRVYIHKRKYNQRNTKEKEKMKDKKSIAIQAAINEMSTLSSFINPLRKSTG